MISVRGVVFPIGYAKIILPKGRLFNASQSKSVIKLGFVNTIGHLWPSVSKIHKKRVTKISFKPSTWWVFNPGTNI